MIIRRNIVTGIVWQVLWCGFPLLRSPFWWSNVKNWFWKTSHSDPDGPWDWTCFSSCGVLIVITNCRDK